MSSNDRDPDISSFDPHNPRLQSVYAKINRAFDHIKDLDAAIDAWRDIEPYSLRTEFNAERRIQRIYIHVSEPMPIYFGLAAGDAIHNMRSALDHLACAAALSNGRSCKGVYFPVAFTKSDYPKSAKEKLRKCSSEFREFIKNLEPYKGGNDMLYALHHLDIIDKHCVIAPMAIGNPIITIAAKAGIFGDIDFSKASGPVTLKTIGGSEFLNHGDTVVDFRSTHLWFPKETDVRTEITVDVAFGDDTPIPGKPVTTTLRELCGLVIGIVEAAEPIHFRR